MPKNSSIIALLIGRFPIGKPLTPYIVMQAFFSIGWEDFMSTPELRVGFMRFINFCSDMEKSHYSVRAMALNCIWRIEFSQNNRTAYYAKWLTPDEVEDFNNKNFPGFTKLRQPKNPQILQLANRLKILCYDKSVPATREITFPRQSEPEVINMGKSQDETLDPEEQDRTNSNSGQQGHWRAPRLTRPPVYTPRR